MSSRQSAKTFSPRHNEPVALVHPESETNSDRTLSRFDMLDAERVKELAPAATFKIRGLRWCVVVLLFLAGLIKFMGRLTSSLLAPWCTQQLGLTNLQFASITTWFLVAFASSQALSC